MPQLENIAQATTMVCELLRAVYEEADNVPQGGFEAFALELTERKVECDIPPDMMFDAGYGAGLLVGMSPPLGITVKELIAMGAALTTAVTRKESGHE